MQDLLIPLEGDANYSVARALVSFRAVRSSGPGGQNVNKVSSKVILTFDFERSDLVEYVKVKLRAMEARLDQAGALVIRCDEHRDQGRNLAAAEEILIEIVREAHHRPKTRRATKPSRGQRERRLEGKRLQSEKKTSRGKID